ncbi:hypothetical protein BROUX41_002897 [Berkeleyomyces rouxiae]|uniref:uncharacterized protein n=1 Tax=Berkeleyomyces rouxiae TaxID=2035830 RepID=UPI003B78887F
MDSSVKDLDPPPEAPHPNQRRSACERCRRLKLKCSRRTVANQTRCHRCKRLNFECIGGRQRKIGRPALNIDAAAAPVSCSTPLLATDTSAPTSTQHRAAKALTINPNNTISAATSLQDSGINTTNDPTHPSIHTTSQPTARQSTGFVGLLPSICDELQDFTIPHGYYRSSSVSPVSAHAGDMRVAGNQTTTIVNEQLDVVSEIPGVQNRIDADLASWSSAQALFPELQSTQFTHLEQQLQCRPEPQEVQYHQSAHFNGHCGHQEEETWVKPFQSQTGMPPLTHQSSVPYAFLFPFPISPYPIFNRSNQTIYPPSQVAREASLAIGASRAANPTMHHGYTELVVKLLHIKTRLQEPVALLCEHEKHTTIDLLLSLDSPLTVGSQPIMQRGMSAIEELFNALGKLHKTLSPKSLDILTSSTIIKCYLQALKFLEVITYYINHTLDNHDIRPLHTISDIWQSKGSFREVLLDGVMFAQFLIQIIDRFSDILGVPVEDPAVVSFTCPNGMLNDTQRRMLYLEMGEQHATWSARPQRLRKDLDYMKEAMAHLLAVYST